MQEIDYLYLYVPASCFGRMNRQSGDNSLLESRLIRLAEQGATNE